MQVQLYHNPRSGGGSCDSSELAQQIEAAGHSVFLKSMHDPPDEDDLDLVAIAGGDGTVEKVIRRYYRALVARRLPITIIPVGTANNIAQSLDLSKQPKWLCAADAAPDLQQTTKKLAIGMLTEPGSERYFIESVGCGALADLIRMDATRPVSRDDIKRHVAAIRTRVRNMDAFDCQVIIDGREYSNRYLLMEVMNTSRAGPGLVLAPDADPGDEYFRTVLIAAAERDMLIEYLEQIQRGANPVNPFFCVTGKRVEFSCSRGGIHVDDKYLNNGGQCRFGIQASAEPLPVMD